jgi:Rod binding domain-containing protein
MTPLGGIGNTNGSAPAPTVDSRAKVRQLAHALEGVFLNQLFQAMRKSVPQDGVLEPAPGQEMFTQIFDERIADEASRHTTRGLGEALYRQLAARLPADGNTEAK